MAGSGEGRIWAQGCESAACPVPYPCIFDSPTAPPCVGGSVRMCESDSQTGPKPRVRLPWFAP